MIPGYGGHLFAEDYVERLLDTPDVRRDAARLQRALSAWGGTASTLGPASSLRAITELATLPLARLLGFEPGVAIALTNEASFVEARVGAERVLLVSLAWGQPSGTATRDALLRARRLRIEWLLIVSGVTVRLVRASQVHARRYVELDLGAGADDPRSAAAVHCLVSAHGLAAPDAAGRGLRWLLADAERHDAAVSRSLRHGVLDASASLLQALLSRERTRPAADAFEQALTVVFRLLFLFFAEARALVPLWHPIYRESYSMEALRDAALGRDAVGLWDSMRAAARLAHGGCRAGGLEVTAFNGRLFSPTRTPLAERRGLDDSAARRAIVAVSTRPSADGESRDRISYRDLGVEQLGAVYETLLDYQPHVEPGRGRRPPVVTLRTGNDARKSSGSFYTPQPLVDYLVRDTLRPLVHEATPDAILERRVLDPSMGSGAFLVGACRYLAGAYEEALVEHGRCHASDLGPTERASIRRLVAERCLFGVDLNPTAVQLARLSLWLTTLAADRPLTFLDHHLRVGDSLCGTWLSRLRTPPVRTRSRADLPLFDDDPAANAIRLALPVRFSLASSPNDTASQVRAKEKALAALSAEGAPLARWTAVADLWCSAWLASPAVPHTAFADLADRLVHGTGALRAGTAEPLLDRARAAGRERALFHWELEFPEVFFDAEGHRLPDGGFDAVIGNPPWDMVRADGPTHRHDARTHTASLVRFVRESGTFEATPDGQVNRYQLFVDRALAITKPGGRLGLVLPSGAMADAGSAPLRQMLFSRARIERIVGFDNTAGTFPIHRSVRFVLMSGTAGERTQEMACRFGVREPSELDAAITAHGAPCPDWFPMRIRPELLTRVSGNDLSIPDVRSSMDLAILERAATLFEPLGSASGWNAHFGRELNATEDRPLLLDDGGDVPVFEGKAIEPFTPCPAKVRWRMRAQDANARLGARWQRSRLAYRDVASATNRVTLIAALLPPRSASTHTLFCLKTPLPVRHQHLLCALLNSLVVNFLVRQRVSTHVTTAIVERLPIPREDQLGPDAEALASDAAALASTWSHTTFAHLNACVARAYGLSRDEFAHVLATFPLIDQAERAQMLEVFEEG